jgi:outer membrane murein-binding lipoprotein Lpp
MGQPPSAHLAQPPINAGADSMSDSQLPYYQLPQSHAPSHTQPHVPLAPPQPDDSQETSPNSAAVDLKRPRACESCRSLKVRCVFEDESPDGSCKRCAKAKRRCVVTAPTRRRQKKADSRVAELERKIDALTATLNATRSSVEAGLPEDERSDEEYDDDEMDESGHAQESYDSQSQSRAMSSGTLNSPVEIAGHRSIGEVTRLAGHKRRRSEGPNKAVETVVHAGERAPPPVTEDPSSVYSFLVPKNATVRPNSMPTPDSSTGSYNNNYDYADVVDRRFISAENANMVFNRYVNELAPHLPMVVFKPGTAASEIRRTKPTLFLAILAAASSVLQTEVQRTLTKELMRVFADKIICNGEKSLEIVQALQVSVIWYWYVLRARKLLGEIC